LSPVGGGERGYSNWELSADRANASRRELVAGGMAESKVVRVVGLGSTVMYDAENPRNPMNRRISIVVLNHDAEERVFSGTEVDTSDGGAAAGSAIGQAGAQPIGGNAKAIGANAQASGLVQEEAGAQRR